MLTGAVCFRKLFWADSGLQWHPVQVLHQKPRIPWRGSLLSRPGTTRLYFGLQLQKWFPNLPHYPRMVGEFTDDSQKTHAVCLSWNNALELISPIWTTCVYVTSFILLYYCSIMNNGCVTCRSRVCLRAGSISLCRLCLNVNPEPMSLLWTGWIGPTNTTLNQQKTPGWWGQKWPSLSTGWRYSTVCRETHC